ncbi:glycerate kinase type-2 family protein [Halocatena pleomorpha]|uniref:Glycerate kinase n=1 Tax=Halocatena pleomorpha TaxID=1785090 RepID=A0A3P3RDD5_9EURY|nr:glycerate kinase [Halocatena pleomorpha]RRJ31415.1 glycerate kinase [Halocatena pleomorpha]
MIENRSGLTTTPAHDVALGCIESGITAAHPRNVIKNTVSVTDDTLRIRQDSYDLNDYSEVLILGGGKAAGQMADVLEPLLNDHLTGGVVVTNDPTATARVTMFEGNHPVPDAGGVKGTKRLLELAEEADERTLILTAITGGGSALLAAPTDTISLADLQAVTDELLAGGATIHEINVLRKHLSKIKGGRLARVAAPATVVGLIVSDVVGDDPDIIASGPLTPDASTFQDAIDIINAYRLSVPESVDRHLAAGVDGTIPETPHPGAAFFETVHEYVLASGRTAVEAARQEAQQRGYETIVLSSRVRGEASEVAKTYIAIAEEVRATGTPVAPPAVVLAGGETTVTLQGDGNGGPNQELALSGSLELTDADTVVASVDTDGIDGASDAAGAIVDSETATPPEAARSALADNDVYPFLDAAEALVHTGPTGTNVNDIQVIVIDDDCDE